MPTTPENPASLSAVEKMLAVLESAVGARRFSDIVVATGLPKGTVHRILSELASHGYIAPTEQGEYAPGPQFLGLAGRAFARLDISGIAKPFVDALGSEVECTVHLGVANGDEVIYVQRRDSSKAYRMPSRVGASVSMHSTAIGKAILTSWDEEALRTYAARTGLRPETPSTITDVEALLAEIAEARARGFAVEREESVPGVTCVAAPITDHTGRVTYAISVSTLAIEHSPAQVSAMAPRVIAAAAQIARALGRPATEPAADA